MKVRPTYREDIGLAQVGNIRMPDGTIKWVGDKAYEIIHAREHYNYYNYAIQLQYADYVKKTNDKTMIAPQWMWIYLEPYIETKEDSNAPEPKQKIDGPGPVPQPIPIISGANAATEPEVDTAISEQPTADTATVPEQPVAAAAATEPVQSFNAKSKPKSRFQCTNVIVRQPTPN